VPVRKEVGHVKVHFVKIRCKAIRKGEACADVNVGLAKSLGFLVKDLVALDFVSELNHFGKEWGHVALCVLVEKGLTHPAG
jgi:hypothetical protein